jgi:PPOX class probable F420-dependent enzyme
VPADEQIGRGVDLRSRVHMTVAEIDDFLTSHRTMSLASLNADGTIHLVAMWYDLIDGAITFGTKAKSQKARNLRRNPTVTCMVEDGSDYNELRGVQVIGTAEVFDDPDRLLELGKTIHERHFGGYTEAALPRVEQMMHKRVGVIVHPTRVASWDHRKL